jgi:ATP-binding cassette subfamily B multidrug efflux pump
MTEQTSALKSKDNNNAAGMQQSHGKPPMQKAAPGTTKRIFGYIFQYKWRVALVVVCILVGAAAQAGSSLFLQSIRTFCRWLVPPILIGCRCCVR